MSDSENLQRLNAWAQKAEMILPVDGKYLIPIHPNSVLGKAIKNERKRNPRIPERAQGSKGAVKEVVAAPAVYVQPHDDPV